MLHFLQVVILLITHGLYNIPFHIFQYLYIFKEFYLKYLKFKILKLRVHWPRYYQSNKLRPILISLVV